MAASAIRFDDGAGYERAMGRWSRLAGEAFVAWLALPPGLQWLDVGCGNGAFTEVVATRCAPASLDGIDPFDALLDYARTRPATRDARFRQGDAMALPYADAAFDVATMALVISFVAEPARAVAELARVMRPGGTVVLVRLHEAESQFEANYIVRSEIRVAGSFAYTRADFDTAVAMLAAGDVAPTAGWLQERDLEECGDSFAELIYNPPAVSKIVLRP